MEMKDFFKSMDEVQEFADKMKKQLNSEQYNCLKKLLGLADQEGEYIEIIGIGKIDKSIANVVKLLNGLGYATLSSCSGVKEEHPTWESDQSGFIAFLDDGNSDRKEYIEKVANILNIQYDVGDAYLKPSYNLRIYGDDLSKKKIWKSLILQ